MKEKEAAEKFLRGLLKLPVRIINGKEYIFTKDIGKLSDKTFGKIPPKE